MRQVNGPQRWNHCIDFWQNVLNQLCELGRVDDINRLYVCLLCYIACLDSLGQIPTSMCCVAYFAIMGDDVGITA
jgi:hypothetical protein